MTIQMACRGRTQDGIRCRNNANGSGYCSTHANDPRKDAVPPTKVLLKSRVNPRWIRRLQEAGVRFVERQEQKLQDEHRQEAEEYRRKADAYRQVPDSGVPIFGVKGAAAVKINGLWAHLEGIGYQVTDTHLYQRPQDKTSGMATLVMEMTLHEEGVVLGNPLIRILLELFEGATWEAVHVWDNPPKEGIGYVQTVNLVHRQPDRIPLYLLVFAGGLWDLKSP